MGVIRDKLTRGRKFAELPSVLRKFFFEGSFWEDKRKAALSLPLAFLAFHAGTQAVNTCRNILSDLHPNELQRYFKEEYGVSLYGTRQGLEAFQRGEFPLSSRLIEVLEQESRNPNFTLRSITIEPTTYTDKSIVQQFAELFADDYVGYAWPRHIVLKPLAQQDTMFHEVKHVESFSIMRQHPEFLERWLALARDEDGNSLYKHPPLVNILYNLKFITEEETLLSSEELRRKGFISDYARTTVLEDMAELGGEVAKRQTDFRLFAEALTTNNWPRLKGKLLLAAEYGLIPEEFPAFINVYKLHKSAWTCSFRSCWLDQENLHQFMETAEAFLNKYPDSIYAPNVRNLRAGINVERARGEERWHGAGEGFSPFFVAAEADSFAVLNNPGVDVGNFSQALSNLSELFRHHGFLERWEFYRIAEKKLLDACKNGVRDPVGAIRQYLVDHGAAQPQ
ncbi:hypothetical protein D6789_02860 [Candidatus Woesearchaeota archaeon]|nr:MAG: hypothetical protein D6789_02860 [Candidatus Woesearchaeota archaeon]